MEFYPVNKALDARIQKRPLLHPSIPSPYSGAAQQKVVYVSARTPFISAAKRVRKLLALIDKRASPHIDLLNSKGRNSEKQKSRALDEVSSGGKGKAPEEVVLKATGKAISKALGLALFFQGQKDCRVTIRTGSVGVVDDIVEAEKVELAQTEHNTSSTTTASGDGGGDSDGRIGTGDEVGASAGRGGEGREGEGNGDEELEETQIRKVSVLEVGISLL